ncbi:MAG: hypothetical protein HEP71_13080 [Roseivirga sp.]|nr:hypothetical protein [Roseivirga sp.]
MSVSGNVVPFGEGFCIYSVTETCWLFGYDSEGIYTAVMTVDDYLDTAECDLDVE